MANVESYYNGVNVVNSSNCAIMALFNFNVVKMIRFRRGGIEWDLNLKIESSYGL